MSLVVVITCLILLHYIYLSYQVGMARGKSGVQAPRMTGDEHFERTLRAQLNTLEQLVITLPALWMCAVYFRADVAAALGLIFLAGRIVYANAYVKEPSSRSIGMMVTFLANVALIATSLYGALF